MAKRNQVNVKRDETGTVVATEDIAQDEPLVMELETFHQVMTGPAENETPPAAADPEPEPIQFLVPASPFGVLPPLPGYARRHIDCQLSAPQAETLGRLLCGLDQAGARLQSGRRVTTAADAVRWLLEWTAQNGREE